MKKYLIEFIGTFFLALTVGCTVLIGGGTAFAPIAIGFALMVMVYAGGYISGGHYNPAVSLGALIRGVLSPKDIVPYVISQFLGAALAALVVIQFVQTVRPVPVNSFHMANLILAEFLFTFALVFVVLNTATSKETTGNSYFGLAIGSTVTVGALAVGAICAAAFNPAVALAVGILHLVTWKIVFVTMGANLLGGIVAAIVYRMTAPVDV